MPLRFNNLLEELTKFRKALQLLLLAYYKEHNPGRVKGERRIDRVKHGGRDAELPCPLWACHPPSTSICSPTQKLNNSGVYEGSIT